MYFNHTWPWHSLCSRVRLVSDDFFYLRRILLANIAIGNTHREQSVQYHSLYEEGCICRLKLSIETVLEWIIRPGDKNYLTSATASVSRILFLQPGALTYPLMSASYHLWQSNCRGSSSVNSGWPGLQYSTSLQMCKYSPVHVISSQWRLGPWRLWLQITQSSPQS